MIKKADAELLNAIRERKGYYAVCCDIHHLSVINETSFEAGNLCILQTLKRVMEEIREDDRFFRVGGDEFVVLTNSGDDAYAKELAERIKAHNGQTVPFDMEEFPLSLKVSVVEIPSDDAGCDDFLNMMNASLSECN